MSLLFRRRLFTGLGWMIAAMSPVPALGQVLATIEFSFSNPGARSMGFGGAFVALADDATASFANPAGLVQLTRPEVSIEARSWSYSTSYTRGGRAAGEPTGIGIDTVAVPLEGEWSVDTEGVSFLSFVYPGKRWALALFQHQLINFELSEEIQGIFAPGNVFEGTFRGPIERGSFDQEVISRGLAAGVRVSDRLSLGLGLSYFDPEILWMGIDYLPDDDTLGGYFAEASFLPHRLSHVVVGGTQEGDLGLSAGFLLTLSKSWKLGAVYREGPEFELAGAAEAGPAHPFLPPGSVESVYTPWAFPDVYGLGVAYRSRDGRWTAGFEWDRVEYSVLIESLSPRLCCPDDFIDDGDELRLGVEYAFLDLTPVFAVRLGLWRDPDHRQRTTSEDPFLRAELLPSEDELHYAAGLGVAFGTFQLDLGVDFSEDRDTASLSIIYTF
jgi:long-subunit fatty acid transport protein